MRTKDEIKALLWECCEKTESNEGITMTLLFDKVADLVIELSNHPTEIVEEPNYEQKFRECHGELMDREKDVERLINERDGAQMNLADMGDELDSVKAKFRECLVVLKRLSLHAQTTGGTAGPDIGLQGVISEAEQFIKANKG